MAVNTDIQGTSAYLLITALTNLRNRMDPSRSRLIMTVHDSIVLEVREDYVDTIIPIMKDCLENPQFCGKPLPFLNIPLVADFEVGPKYGSMKKIKV
jgi:DNA polymerase-1